MSAPAVLLVDCPPGLDGPLRHALTEQDMLLADRLHVPPQVVLMWLAPLATDAGARVDGLRERYRRSAPAVVGLSSRADAHTLIWATSSGLDGLLDSSDPREIAAHARLIVESRTRFAQASPLTGLPGAGALEREINRRLPRRGEMALLAFDVDHFKGYNDIYGYQRGDAVLRAAWVAIEQALSAAPGSFLAHLGGDDFFALVRPTEAQAVAERAIQHFAASRNEHYAGEDLARGGVVCRTRTGEEAFVPLVSLTVVSVTNEAEDLQHSGQFAAVLAELKAYAKQQGGGRYVADRRRVHDAAAAWALREQHQPGEQP